MRDIHRRALERGFAPFVPATVLAQAWRRPSVDLRRLMAGCYVSDLTESIAYDIGGLLAAAGTSDVVDAHVVLCCIAEDGTCVTSDPKDIDHLAETARTMRPQLARRHVARIAL
jgi:hypothetical protein